LGALNYLSFDLADLEVEISGEEVKVAVNNTPKENAPDRMVLLELSIINTGT
jgi:hypothetical protein